MATAIINALIVLPSEAGGPRETVVRFDDARILSLGQPPHRHDAILDLAGRIVYPGLINAHDHIEMNHYPRTKFRAIYTNAKQWSEDFSPKLVEEPFASLRRLPVAEQCAVGALKNLRSGVTTVAQHNPLHPPLRRRDFPVRVVKRYGWAHSLYLEQDILASYRRTPPDAPWMIHLAEGTDDEAAGELKRLQDLGCLRSNTVLIHGVGLTAEDRINAIAKGTGLVWCPSSNFFLLGKTAEVAAFADAELLALGTDSRLTADGDMLDELRAAYATGQLSPERLFRAVTTDAAKLLRLTNTGALLPGYTPDFFVARRPSSDPILSLFALDSRDIEAVYVGGRLRYRQS